MAFVAVQKVTKAKWSGVMIRFAEAAPFLFFPVSLIGFLLIFTVGYSHIFPAMEGLGHGKEIWLSHGFMFWRLFVGLCLLYYLGYRLIRADLIPDMFETKGCCPVGAAPCTTGGPRATTTLPRLASGTIIRSTPSLRPMS